MIDKNIQFPVSKKTQIARVFRQKAYWIAFLSVFFTHIYYPFFLYRRRKALKEVVSISRYYFHVLFPLIVMGVSVLISFGITLYFCLIELSMHMTEIDSGKMTTQMLLENLLGNNVLNTSLRILNIIALLSFIGAMIDILVLLSEKLQKIRVHFPKFLHYTPIFFTISAFVYALASAVALNPSKEAQTLLMMSQIIFIVSLISVHLYLKNSYILFRTFQIEGDLK